MAASGGTGFAHVLRDDPAAFGGRAAPRGMAASGGTGLAHARENTSRRSDRLRREGGSARIGRLWRDWLRSRAGKKIPRRSGRLRREGGCARNGRLWRDWPRSRAGKKFRDDPAAFGGRAAARGMAASGGTGFAHARENTSRRSGRLRREGGSARNGRLWRDWLRSRLGKYIETIRPPSAGGRLRAEWPPLVGLASLTRGKKTPRRSGRLRREGGSARNGRL
jgi:hypothetical protein